MAEIRVGISGWRYAPWRGDFYPEDLPQKRELEYASRQLNSIEINGTFYSLQRPSSFSAWDEATPEDFVFSVKCPRFITHIRRLREVEEPLANFFASGVLGFGKKLGPLLWQFPPTFKFDEAVFEAFLKQLPHDMAAAVVLAKHHGSRMKGRTFIPDVSGKEGKRKVRHAVEIRHASFLTERFIRLLRREKMALVIADTAGLHPFTEDVTADFLYLRLHGAEEIYASGYTEEALKKWATRIRAWKGGGEPEDAVKVLPEAPTKRKTRDVYVYFDNDIKVRAPFDAQHLMGKLK